MLKKINNQNNREQIKKIKGWTWEKSCNFLAYSKLRK